MSLDDKQWIIEAFEDRTAFAVKYSRVLVERQSDFQTIRIFDTDAMGRTLILNGCFMVTEADAFLYHEMLVHPALNVIERPGNVLVIGGGDGGAVTEIVKHPGVESVTLCEIDPLVIDLCREHFPEISAGLSDPRVNVACEDGAAFVARKQSQFDVILVDSTDPVDHGKALFEPSFYGAVKNALRPGGAAVFQTESPLFMKEVFIEAYRNLSDVFGPDETRPYFTVVPSYPGGLWSFTICSPGIDPTEPSERATELGTSYYGLDIHRAAFAQPVFVKKALGASRRNEIQTGRPS